MHNTTYSVHTKVPSASSPFVGINCEASTEKTNEPGEGVWREASASLELADGRTVATFEVSAYGYGDEPEKDVVTAIKDLTVIKNQIDEWYEAAISAFYEMREDLKTD